MKVKTPAAGGMLPEGIVPWNARYDGVCVCGRKIKQGQPCVYDKRERKILCKPCAKLAAKGELTKHKPSPEEERLLERVKQIYVMRRPLDDEHDKEMQLLTVKMRHEFSTSYAVRRLLVEVMNLRVNDDVVCISMKYSDRCHGCGEKQIEGSAAIWNKRAHRIWCLDCHAEESKPGR